MRPEILRMESVTKKKGGVTLLDQFNLHIYKGEIMGLLPLNTHGKETLLDILCNHEEISKGRIYFNEEQYYAADRTPHTRNRVYVIEKTSSLSRNLTVADNIFVLRRGFQKYLINNEVLSHQAKQLAAELGVFIDPYETIERLTPFQCCVVELIKGIAGGAKLIVLNEISNFLGPLDLIAFQEILRRLRERGTAFLYIASHHEEVFRICDRTCLLKNGKIIKVLDKRQFSLENLQPYILDYYLTPPKSFQMGEPLLKFDGVSTDHLDRLSFQVRQGECVVLLDMNNTVFDDILRLMNGELAPRRGTVTLHGEPYTQGMGKKAVQNGVAFIGEAPVASTLFPEMSYLDNLCFLLDQKDRTIRLNPKVKRSITREYEPLCGEDIHVPTINRLEAASLYNLAYFRVHLLNPGVVFCVQPFFGADMYLRNHVVNLIDSLKQRGIAVVILAVSISDTLSVGNRLVLIRRGRQVREYLQAEFQQIHPDDLLTYHTDSQS